MLDDEFKKRRALLVRDLASRADPFIKRRLLDLASRYEKPASSERPHGKLPTANDGSGRARPDHNPD